MNTWKKTSVAALAAVVIATSTSTTPAVYAGKNSVPDIVMMKGFIDLMDTYLDLSEQWMKLVGEEDTTVYLVAERVTEIYEKKGSKIKAIPALTEMLQQFEGNTAVRNALHFKISEIYKDAGQHDSALEHLQKILHATR